MWSGLSCAIPHRSLEYKNVHFSIFDFVGTPDCSDVCKINEGPVAALTQENKTFAENDCIPVLKSWNKQYRVNKYTIALMLLKITGNVFVLGL